MTNENIIKQLKRLISSLQYADDVNAVKGAIQALSQEPTISRLERRVDDNTVVFRTIDGEEVEYVRKEPCDDTVSIRKDVLKCRVGNIVAYNVEWLKKHWQMEMDIVCGVKPCDDAISRDAVMRLIENKPYDWSNLTERHNMLMEIRKLPLVTQKSGKWIEDAKTYYEELNKRGLGVDEYTPYFTDDIACSKCLAKYNTIDNQTQFFKYCPNCGAKMESEARND